MENIEQPSQSPEPPQAPQLPADIAQIMNQLSQALASLPPAEGLHICRTLVHTARAWGRTFHTAIEEQAAAPLSGPELARQQKLWDALTASIAHLPQQVHFQNILQCARTPDGKVWLRATLDEQKKPALIEIDVFSGSGSATYQIREDGIEYFDAKHPERPSHWKAYKPDLNLDIQAPTPEQALKKIKEVGLQSIPAKNFP